jgi:hypothetical protein
MVIQVLAAHLRPAVCVRVVAPAEYARARQVVRQQVAQPVHTVARRPRLLAVAVEAMDRDNAGRVSASEGEKRWWEGALDNWVDALIHYLQAMLDCASCLYWRRRRSRRFFW